VNLSEINVENSKTKYGKYLLLVLFLIGAVIFALNFNLTDFRAFLDGHEQIGAVACVCVYFLLGVTPIFSEPLTLLVLAWQGPLVAIVVASIGNTGAGVVEYFIGRGMRDLTDFEAKKARLPFNLGKLPISSPVFMLLGRMVPGLGAKVLSIAAGVYKVPMFTYVWTTLVSNVLGAALVVMGGYGILKLIFGPSFP